MVYVTVHMTSGMGLIEKDNEIRIVDDGTSLKISVIWPRVLTDSTILHESWIESDPDFHVDNPQVEAFLPLLLKLRDCSDEEIVSRCTIDLPFEVKTAMKIIRTNTSILKWSAHPHVILFITLEAHDSSYVVDDYKTHTMRTA